jgi:hypothetical protein
MKINPVKLRRCVTPELDWTPPPAAYKARMSRYYPRTPQELDAMSPEDFARLMKRDRVHGEALWPIPRPRNAVWLRSVSAAKKDFLRDVLRVRRPFYVYCGTVELFIVAGIQVPGIHASASAADYAESAIRHWVEDSWEWRVAQRACDDLNDLYEKGRREFDNADVDYALQRAKRVIPAKPGPGLPVPPKKDWELETERIFKWARKEKKLS